MLGIDRKNESRGGVEPGGDPGILEVSDAVGFKGRHREDVYDWVYQTLRQVRYQDLKRTGRGLVRRYVSKMTGLSRSQSSGLLSLYLRGEEVKPKPYRRHSFPKRYSGADVELLATVDEAHGTPSPRLLSWGPCSRLRPA